MANGKVFVSPGVYTSERDLTFVTQSVGVTTLGIVGETLQGPAFEPIFITNYDEFTTTFGGINPEKFIGTTIPKYEAAYIAKAYLQESNQLYVTRILGLSGYDAGPSWSITTIANPDVSTLSITGTSGPSYIYFTGTSAGITSVTLPSPISGAFYDTFVTYDGGSSSIQSQIETLMVTEIGRYNTSSSATTALFFGSVSANTYTAVTASSVTAVTEVYGVNTLIANNSTDFSPSVNDPWFYSNQFSYYQDVNNVGHYYGYGFGTKLATMNSLGGGIYSGSFAVYLTNYDADSYADYDDIVVATLRSRGIATYISDNGPVYKVSATTAVTLVPSLSSGMTSDPYATFKISGITTDNTTFTFDANMDYLSTKFISKVFGIANFADGKDRDTFPLFVEETYPAFLQTAYYKNKIRGLNSTLLALPGLRTSPNTNTLGYYLDRYQTPETPHVVSELRGNKVYKLFKIKLISDGTKANYQVKFSIRNVSFNNGTFDLVVRSFYDTDANVTILESFNGCSLDPTQNNYIANKIGTSNGEYALKSKYIMLVMSDEAPTDALPCGFEGYTQRVYANSKPPFIEYKTQYYGPNEVIYNPPFGAAGGGDNTINAPASGEKLNKNYLGIADQTGFDTDFFLYKGKQAPVGTIDNPGSEWSWKTQGFHMDSGATVVTIGGTFSNSGDSSFQVGEASFTSDPTDQDNPYYKLVSRKFTFYAYGGFDGWDIYTESRRNTDRFTLGANGWLKGARQSASYPTATGTGLFKLITGPNQEVWGNTDYFAYLWGQKTFANPEAVDINIFVTPGVDYVNNSNLVSEAVDMIEDDRADSIYITTTPDYNLFTTSSFETLEEYLVFPDEAVDNLDTANIDSNYTATYYPWVLTRDNENNTQLFLPATAEVCRNLALTDKIFKPWFASAGYTRGLVNSIKSRKTLTQDDRDVLYKGRINPIATFTDVGTVIWGNKTLQVKESALDRINVRRLLLRARKLISAVAVRLLFEQNDQKVRQDFLDSVNPILDEIRRDRGLIDFRVTVSNTPEDLDSNTLTGKIYLKPTRALEYIDIEFVITPTGASFEDV
jgi:hypothetical protein